MCVCVCEMCTPDYDDSCRHDCAVGCGGKGQEDQCPFDVMDGFNLSD